MAFVRKRILLWFLVFFGVCLVVQLEVSLSEASEGTPLPNQGINLSECLVRYKKHCLVQSAADTDPDFVYHPEVVDPVNVVLVVESSFRMEAALRSLFMPYHELESKSRVYVHVFTPKSDRERIKTRIVCALQEFGPSILSRVRVVGFKDDVMQPGAYLPASQFPLYLGINNWFRFFIPYLLPKTVKKIVYLDSDVVVRANIAELHDSMPLKGDWLAARPQPWSAFKHHFLTDRPSWADFRGKFQPRLTQVRPEEVRDDNSNFFFFNAGVWVADMEAWLSNDITQVVADFAKFHIALPAGQRFCSLGNIQKDTKYNGIGTQSAMGITFLGKVSKIEYNWNVDNALYPSQQQAVLQAKIVHYTSFKPWSTPNNAGNRNAHNLWKTFDKNCDICESWMNPSSWRVFETASRFLGGKAIIRRRDLCET